MNSRYTEWFRFESVALPEDTFHVIRFSGTEGLNTLFSFAVDLVSRKPDIDPSELLHNRAVLTIVRQDGGKAVFGGYPSEVTQAGHFNGYTYYSVVLRPAFWKLCGVVQSRIFLGKNVQQVVTELLRDHTYFSFDHQFRLGRSDYPVPEFAMQHEESVHNYICWRLEEQGIAYHFEQNGITDTLIFSDTPQIYTELPDTPTLRYSPPSGLQATHALEVVSAFSLACKPLPRRVAIRTYNWQNPNKPVVGMADVSPTGLGDVHLSREAVENDAEASRLARIRAEELLCGSRVFSGISAVPSLRPGFLFTLGNHYNPAFNRSYFLTSVTHEGSQEAFLTLGLGIPMHNAQEHYFYHNNFSCIESGVQYRPARTTPRATAHGVIHAFIDGAGSGSRPELDAFGRYKVIFPFDISTREKGNASCWIRMAQSQVGNFSGMSFPLLPGTEVAVIFQDGNPDRPLITGAVPNGETGALTGPANAEFSGIRTPGGSQVTFNDTNSKQGIALKTASGRGLTMSAGSLDSASLSTDAWLGFASTMSSDVSSLGHSLFSGYKASQCVSRLDKWGVINAAASACLNITQSAFATASSCADSFDEKQGFSFGADTAKLVNMAVQAATTAVERLKGQKSSYAATTRAIDGETFAQLQVKPDVKKLIAGIVVTVIGQITQIAVESTSVALAGNEEESKKAYVSALTAAMQALVAYDTRKESPWGTAEQSSLPPKESGELCGLQPPVVYDIDHAITEIQDALYRPKPASTPEATPPDQEDTPPESTPPSEEEASTPLPDPAPSPEPEALTPAQAMDEAQLKEHLAALQAAKSGLLAAWSGYCDSDADNAAYYKNKKMAAAHELFSSSLSSLIPEILTLVLVGVSLNKADSAKLLGGVLTEAVEGNVSLSAHGPVSMHTPSGIFLNARYAKKDGTGEEATLAFNDQTTKATLKAFLGGTNAPVSSWGVPEPVTGAATTFFSPTPAAVFPYKSTQKMTEHFQSLPEMTGTASMTTVKGTPYVAVCGELLYTEGKWRQTSVEKDNSVSAANHYIQTRDVASTIRLLTPENNTSAGGIIIAANGENHPNNALHTVHMSYTGKDKDDVQELMLSEKEFKLSSKSKNSAIAIAGKGTELTLSAGGDDAAKQFRITIGEKGIAMSKNTDTAFTFNDEGFTVHEKGKIVLGGISIKGTALSVVSGSKLDLGGEITITGPSKAQGVKFSELEKQVTQQKSALTQLDEKSADIMKQMEKLRNEMEKCVKKDDSPGKP